MGSNLLKALTLTLFSIIFFTQNTLAWELDSSKTKLILTQCELRQYGNMYPSRISALQANGMKISAAFTLQEWNPELRIRGLYRGEFEVGKVASACEKEIAEAAAKPDGKLTAKSHSDESAVVAAGSAAAAVPESKTSSTAAKVPHAYDSEWTTDPKTGIKTKRSYGEHGEEIVITQTPDGKVSQTVVNNDAPSGASSASTGTDGSGVPQTVINPEDRKVTPVVVGTDETKVPGASVEAAVAAAADNAKVSASGDDKKPPSAEAVSQASNTLYNASVALQGASDIATGMKQGGLKGFAQAATGAISIAQLLDPVDSKAMSAGATAFDKQVKATVTTITKIPGATASTIAVQKLSATSGTYLQAVLKCTEQLSTSKGVCNEMKNGKAMAVTQLMTAGASLISNVTSASETCSSLADITKVAGLGMAGVGLMCSDNMKICQSDCAMAGKILKQIQADLSGVRQAMGKDGILLDKQCAYGNCEPVLALNAAVPVVEATAAAATKEEGTTISSTVLSCAGLGLQVLNFASQVSDLMKSSSDADKCKKALTAGGGSGNGSAVSNITTAEMCSNAANSSLQVCKCLKDEKAEGCPGAIANKTGNSSGAAGLVLKNNGGASQMAGFGTKSGSGSGSGGNFNGGNGSGSSGLSDAARNALGLNNSASGGGAAGDTAGAIAAGSGGSGSAADKAAGLKDDKEKKSLFNGFGLFSGGSGIGSLFGGGSKNNKGSSNFQASEQQIANAKRQIASAQLRNEISTASGKSNWDKIRARYVENRGTLIGD